MSVERALLGLLDLGLSLLHVAVVLAVLMLWIPKATRFERVLQSRLENAKGRRFELGDLSSRSRPVTFTCDPPQPEQAEARRSAFDVRRGGRH